MPLSPAAPLGWLCQPELMEQWMDNGEYRRTVIYDLVPDDAGQSLAAGALESGRDQLVRKVEEVRRVDVELV